MEIRPRTEFLKMSDEWTIVAQHVSKKFGLTLKQSMKYGLRDSAMRLVGRTAQNEVLRPGEFWAVRDVSFELNRGESLGIMGINGSGKTTLLRILNGTYAPDTGQVSLRGQIGALIAAGAGFSPTLTGRENVYINASILGMSRSMIKNKLEEILAFSELGEFIDMPIKHYSSGMVVRLAFAITAISEPDVLLVDEVLAVGDLNFQKKCLDYLLRLKRKGTSIVLVSHSIAAVWMVCDKAILMHHGAMDVNGTVEDVTQGYENRTLITGGEISAQVSEKTTTEAQGAKEVEVDGLQSTYGYSRIGTKDVVGYNLQIRGSDDDRPRLDFGIREPLVMEIDIDVINQIDMPLFRYVLDAMEYKNIVVIDSWEQNYRPSSLKPGKYRLRVSVLNQNLLPGPYVINFAVCQKGVGVHLFLWLKAKSFVIRHQSQRGSSENGTAFMSLESAFELEGIDQQKRTGSAADCVAR